MPRWVWTTLRLTPTVAGASLLSVFGLLMFRGLVPQSDLVGSSNEVGNYLQTVGGIYAVLLAFVVYVVWGQFNEARSFCDREAAALIDLHRTVGALPQATRDDIQKALRGYVDSVLADEWKAMADGDEATIERVGERLDHVWHAIHGCEPVSNCQHAVYSEVLTQFNELMDLRTNRLSSARARMPLAMKILLITGAVITTGSMYLLAFDKVWIHVAVTAALAGAIAHVLFLIVDLDDAFAGDWQVAKSPFVRARRTFDRAARVGVAA